MQRVNFSNHLAIVYTLIVACPLMLFIFGGSEYLRSSMYDSIAQDAKKSVADNSEHIANSIEQIERLESIITSDYELLRTFYFADASDETTIIETLQNDIKNLERLQFAMPQIYGLHIYLKNTYIPERWPIVFSEKRIDFSKLDRWTYNYRDEIMGNLVSSKVPSVCLTREILLNKRHVGYLQISMQMTDFFPFLFTAKDPYFGDYVFFRNELLGPPDQNSLIVRNELMAENPESMSGSFVVRIGNENLIVSYARIPRLDLLVVHTSSPAVITKSIFMIRAASFLLLFASVALLFVIINFATKKLFSRLYIVMDGMRKIREGNLDVSVYVSGNDEVAEMAHTFSAMVLRIQKLVSEITKEQELVTQTEVKAMQNQINAHFLYNVLETIKMQAELGDQHEIAESITLLGRMMRYCLRWRNHRVPLRQEIEYISDYIALMNIRNDYSISLSLDIEENLLDHEIPKMLIQPVVENAVQHAIEPKGEDAVIAISAKVDSSGKLLLLQIRDTGIGMDSDMLDRIGNKLDRHTEAEVSIGGIGLQNIQQRLHAFYGNEYSLKIQSTPGLGTEVVIPVPLEMER